MGLSCSAFADDLCENKYRPPFGEPGDVTQCRAEQASGKEFVWDWLGKNGVKSLDQLAKQKGELFSFVARWCIKPEEGDGQDWAVAAYCLKRVVKETEEKRSFREKCVKAGERPTIGMTYEQAVATCWGKPESINRTTRQGHVEDQAVYADHRRYLNFNDGVLTSIQESGAAP
jgi:hypothetical protein